ncbi:MAG TPA: TetR/AcrR family transcriptional regulator [Novosphingobium sp.]|nr:TetR/AcrR family transcriptional regulator [Novosphingobium sp.]
MTQSTAVRDGNRRERGKANRRDRILTAAKELIQETGTCDFPMGDLAKRAGVSHMTVYNLMGTRQDIILQIHIDEMVRGTIERVSGNFEDPLDEMLGMVPYMRQHFSARYRYRRTIVFGLYQDGAEEVRKQVRDIFMTRVFRTIEECRVQGLVRASTDVSALVVLLDNIYTANVLGLAVGDIDEAIFEARAQYGYAVALLSVVTAEHAARVRAILEDCELRCRELEPEGQFVRRDLPEV